MTLAIADFDEAIRLDPRAFASFDKRAALRFTLGDYRGAVNDYTEVLALIPRDQAAPAYNGRGAARHILGDYDGALADYNQAIDIDPGLCIAYISRGNARYHKRDLRGIEDHRTAFRLDPGLTVREMVRGFRADLGRGHEAVLENCRKHIRIHPDDLMSYTRRGITLILLGRDSEAEPDLDTVLEPPARLSRPDRAACRRSQAEAPRVLIKVNSGGQTVVPPVSYRRPRPARPP